MKKATNMILVFKYIPNILTSLRIFLAPILAFLIIESLDKHYVLILFLAIFLFLTDFFDGFLSRKFNLISNFGICMDPIADKVLVLLVMTSLILAERLHFVFLIIILMREIIISGIREFVILNNQKKIEVNGFGKLKTTIQMLAIMLSLTTFYNHSITLFFWVVSSFITILSFLLYCLKAFNK